MKAKFYIRFSTSFFLIVIILTSVTLFEEILRKIKTFFNFDIILLPFFILFVLFVTKRITSERLFIYVFKFHSYYVIK